MDLFWENCKRMRRINFVKFDLIFCHEILRADYGEFDYVDNKLQIEAILEYQETHNSINLGSWEECKKYHKCLKSPWNRLLENSSLEVDYTKYQVEKYPSLGNLVNNINSLITTLDFESEFWVKCKTDRIQDVWPTSKLFRNTLIMNDYDASIDISYISQFLYTPEEAEEITKKFREENS
jgi:hypothetical protein